jgi:hypothetical protein
MRNRLLDSVLSFEPEENIDIGGGGGGGPAYKGAPPPPGSAPQGGLFGSAAQGATKGASKGASKGKGGGKGGKGMSGAVRSLGGGGGGLFGGGGGMANMMGGGMGAMGGGMDGAAMLSEWSAAQGMDGMSFGVEKSAMKMKRGDPRLGGARSRGRLNKIK